MNKNNISNTMGLSAVIAAAAILSLGLSNPAYAADDHNSSRSNKSSSSADQGGSEASVEALSETMSEIDALLSSIQDGLSQASSLHAQLMEQSSSLSEARAASSASSEETLTQIEDARRAFESSVAPLLDPSTVEAVSLHFQKIEMEARAMDEDSDDDGFGDELEEVSSSLASALSALDSCKTASSELITTYDLKAAKK